MGVVINSVEKSNNSNWVIWRDVELVWFMGKELVYLIFWFIISIFLRVVKSC